MRLFHCFACFVLFSLCEVATAAPADNLINLLPGDHGLYRPACVYARRLRRLAGPTPAPFVVSQQGSPLFNTSCYDAARATSAHIVERGVQQEIVYLRCAAGRTTNLAGKQFALKLSRDLSKAGVKGPSRIFLFNGQIMGRSASGMHLVSRTNEIGGRFANPRPLVPIETVKVLEMKTGAFTTRAPTSTELIRLGIMPNGHNPRVALNGAGSAATLPIYAHPAVAYPLILVAPTAGYAAGKGTASRVTDDLFTQECCGQAGASGASVAAFRPLVGSWKGAGGITLCYAAGAQAGNIAEAQTQRVVRATGGSASQEEGFGTMAAITTTGGTAGGLTYAFGVVAAPSVSVAVLGGIAFVGAGRVVYGAGELTYWTGNSICHGGVVGHHQALYGKTGIISSHGIMGGRAGTLDPTSYPAYVWRYWTGGL